MRFAIIFLLLAAIGCNRHNDDNPGKPSIEELRRIEQQAHDKELSEAWDRAMERARKAAKAIKEREESAKK